MFPQELHRTLRLGDAEVDDALLQDLLDVVLLHEDLAALQTLVFFQSGGGGGHLIAYAWGSGEQQGEEEEGRWGEKRGETEWRNEEGERDFSNRVEVEINRPCPAGLKGTMAGGRDA